MIQLEHQIKIDFHKYIVLLDDEQAEKFLNNLDLYDPRIIYLEETVFLPDLITKKLKSAGVKIINIPRYFFDL